MSDKVTRQESKAENQLNSIWPVMGMVLFAIPMLSCLALNSHAAIVGTGDVNPADPASWTSSTVGYIGKTSTGTLTVDGGSELLSDYTYLGYDSGSIGTATVTGTGSKWTNGSSLNVGHSGNGTLKIEAGGQVSSTGGNVGKVPGSSGTVTVTGIGSKWTNSGSLVIGKGGASTLNIEAGGVVTNSDVALYSSSATVTGNGSQWGASGIFRIFSSHSLESSLKIEAGAKVNVSSCEMDFGTAIVTGAGSSWFVLGNGLTIGSKDDGVGILKIEAGGRVENRNAYLGSGYGGTGTATITGSDSKWTSYDTLFVGSLGKGTLNIGSDSVRGGLVTARYLTLGSNTGSTGTCNINNGGTLKAGTIARGNGTPNFIWNDGTIQNYDVNTDLFISPSYDPVLKLAASGTHAFNIDAGRRGTVGAFLIDATIGGTLTKQGDGLLTLTKANTYSGKTTVEAGQFKVTGSILNTSGMDVSAGATLELAKTSGSATAASLAISNAGTILISAGSQTVGMISGTGVTQVNLDATLTVKSIVQDSLFIGTTGAASMGGETISQVPEPGMVTLLAFGLLGMAVVAWRRSS